MLNSKLRFLDSHIHLDDPVFADNLEHWLDNARKNHINGWIIPSTTAESFLRISQLAAHYPNVYAAYGLHPYFIESHTTRDLLTLRQFIESHPAVAIGECGLDAMIPNPNMDQQLDLFKEHIRLALEFDLPLIVHARKTVDLILKEIRKHPNLRGVLHSFSGSLQQAEIACQHNFLLGFGGACTFPRAQKLHAIICSVSLNHILIETDAPFQRGFYRQHGVHYPEDLYEVAKAIAILREEPLQLIAHTTTANAKKLFRLKDQ